MLVLPVLVFPVLLIRFHLALALGFVAGSAISFFNFYWLKRAVVALGERVALSEREANSGSRQSGSSSSLSAWGSPSGRASTSAATGEHR